MQSRPTRRAIARSSNGSDGLSEKKTGAPLEADRRSRRVERAALVEHVSDSTRRDSLLDSARELVQFREVIRSFTERTLRVRYKQTALGIAWVVLQPLLLLVVFMLVFDRVVGVSTGSVPYAAFALSAIVPWQFVSTSVTIASSALVADASLLRKVYFPREAPILGALGAGVLDVLIGSLVIVALAPLTGARLGWSVVFLPVLVIALLLPVMAVSLPLAALTVYYRDFRYVIPFAVQVWLFLSPVAYPVTAVREGLRVPYAAANPIVGSLEGFRRVFAVGAPPNWTLLGVSVAASLALLLLAARVFTRLEREFADVI